MLQYDFMVNAFAATFIVACVAGAIGYFMVLRGQTFAGHALSHVGFAGATGAALVGLSPLVGLTAFTIVAGVGVGVLGERAQGRDVAIGIVLSLSLGLGLLFLNFYTSFAGQATTLLFGNVLGVRGDDLIVIAVTLLAAALIVFFCYKQLLFITFDRDVARIYGVRVEWVDTLLSLVLAATIIVSMQTLGVTLIAAALVIPASAARLLTHRFGSLLWLASALGAGMSVLGMYASYYLDMASGATIVLVGIGMFAAAWLISAGKLRR
jgi:zinc/manganese transport system permease protein